MFRIVHVSMNATRVHFAKIENPGRTLCGRSTTPAVFGTNVGPVFATIPDTDPAGFDAAPCRSCVRIGSANPTPNTNPTPSDAAPIVANPSDPMRAAPLVGAVLFVFVVFVASMF